MTIPRKPVVRRVSTRPAAYGVRSELVVTIHPSGQLSIREAGRHQSSAVYFELSEIYCDGIRRKALAAKRERKRKF